MKLAYCSITGADDAVDPKDLLAITKEYPFVEWAILYSPERAGLPRFPKPEWIREFAQTCRESQKAMHVCDGALLGFINKDPEVLKLMRGFPRIQLNLKFGDMNGKYDPAALVARVKESPQWTFILQHSSYTKDVLPLFDGVPNCAILFDESAGSGVNPGSWSAPLPGRLCGYAGGLGPENMADNLVKISQVVPEEVTTWVDMESRVRTNDKFDLGKSRSVLAITKPWACTRPMGSGFAWEDPSACGSLTQ